MGQEHHSHPRSSEHPDVLHICTEVWKLRWHRHWFWFAFCYLIVVVPCWRTWTGWRIGYQQRYRLRSNIYWERCSGFSNSSSQQQLSLQWLWYQRPVPHRHRTWLPRWWFRSSYEIWVGSLSFRSEAGSYDSALLYLWLSDRSKPPIC